jgi:hypothetical protein
MKNSLNPITANLGCGDYLILNFVPVADAMYRELGGDKDLAIGFDSRGL